MGKFQGVRRISLSVCFLIITFALSIHMNCAEAGGIGPNQGFDSVTVLANQKATVDITQIGPFGMHTVGFLSVGNLDINVNFEVGKRQNAEGLWYLILFGPGGHDASTRSLYATTGLVSVDKGKSAKVNIDNWCLGFATGGVLLFSPVSAADPFKYTISVISTKRAPVH